MRGDLGLHFHQSISPLSEENILDLDLGVLCGFSICSSSLIPLIAFVALVEFESGGFEHLSGVLTIAFGASV